jgi:hypothetical protein
VLATELRAAAAGEQTAVQAIAGYERQMTAYGFAAAAPPARPGSPPPHAGTRRLLSHLPAPR